MKPRLIIVGNALLKKDLSKFIDSSDFVIRCNDCISFGGNTGTKTDVLCIRNNGAPALKFIKNKSVNKLPRFPNLSEVWFPRFVLPEFDYKDQIISSNGLHGLRYRSFSKELNEKVCENIRIESKREIVVPSTGFLLINYILEEPEFNCYDKFIAGFSFEMSFEHSSNIEKNIVIRLCNDRSDLHFVPVSRFWKVERIFKKFRVIKNYLIRLFKKKLSIFYK
ncbi:MAG: glycosyltransferase family 29 protein [Saprospiraceae bacterium]